jgi:hypothetical protein
MEGQNPETCNHFGGFPIKKSRAEKGRDTTRLQSDHSEFAESLRHHHCNWWWLYTELKSPLIDCGGGSELDFQFGVN